MTLIKRTSMENRSSSIVEESEAEGLLENATPLSSEVVTIQQHLETTTNNDDLSNPSASSTAMNTTASSTKKSMPLTVDTSNGNSSNNSNSSTSDTWGLLFCFGGIMISFVSNNLLLEKATSSSSYQLHELSFILVTSAISVVVSYSLGRIQQQPITPLPWTSFGLVGLLNLGSVFFSVVSLRYVIFPVKVLAKACKPVTVMLCGFCLGKRYPLSKYLSVLAIVSGVALFMGGGETSKAKNSDDSIAFHYQLLGILMISISLCFDGGLGAFEDRIVGQYNLQSLDLMYKISASNVLLAAASLIVTNQLDQLTLMWHEMGYMLLALGLTAAMGQIFIFLTITRYGSLTCSLMGLARKVTTICASIYVYGHSLTALQFAGLLLSVGAMAYKPLQEYLAIQRNSPTALIREWHNKIFFSTDSTITDDGKPSDDESRHHRALPGVRPAVKRMLLPLGLSFIGLGIVTGGPISLLQSSSSPIENRPLQRNAAVSPPLVIQLKPSSKEESSYLRKPAVPPS